MGPPAKVCAAVLPVAVTPQRRADALALPPNLIAPGIPTASTCDHRGSDTGEGGIVWSSAPSPCMRSAVPDAHCWEGARGPRVRHLLHLREPVWPQRCLEKPDPKRRLATAADSASSDGVRRGCVQLAAAIPGRKPNWTTACVCQRDNSAALYAHFVTVSVLLSTDCRPPPRRPTQPCRRPPAGRVAAHDSPSQASAVIATPAGEGWYLRLGGASRWPCQAGGCRESPP